MAASAIHFTVTAGNRVGYSITAEKDGAPIAAPMVSGLVNAMSARIYLNALEQGAALAGAAVSSTMPAEVRNNGGALAQLAKEV